MSSYKDPSTETAKFKDGFRLDPYTGRKRLGAEDRLIAEVEMNNSRVAREAALQAGIPDKIEGRPLGCGCNVAYLSSVAPPKDGLLEADYQCSSAWHNYVVFQVRQYTGESEHGLHYDKFGNIIESEGFQAGELDAY